MPKRKVFFREFPFNRLTWPLLLNTWESCGIDRFFDIRVALKRSDLVDCSTEDVLCYSFMTPNAPLVAEEIAGLPQRRGILIAGGPHVSGNPEMAMRMGFDFVFCGAAERKFQAFGRTLAQGSLAGFDRLQYEQESDFSSFFPISRYFKRLPPLELQRGCRHACKFCQTAAITPHQRTMDSIEAYLEKLASRRARRINFIAPSALDFNSEKSGAKTRENLEKLFLKCRAHDLEIIEYGIFPSEIRPDQMNQDNAALLRRFVANHSLTMGLQSCSEERLRAIGRGHDLEPVLRAVAIANENGFRANLDLILALPGETRTERRNTFSLLKEIKKTYRVRIQVHHFFPLAGSAFAENCPAWLESEEKEELHKLKKAGLITDWWQAGEKAARLYREWKKTI